MSYRIVQHSGPLKRVPPAYLVPMKRVTPRGRQTMGMVYGVHQDQLGFSLKPPKWVRKMQPGKILAKAAIPIAAVGAALLIPGVGAAVGGALASAGGAIASGATGAFKLASTLVKAPIKTAYGAFGVPIKSVGLSPISRLASAAKSASTALQLMPSIPGGVPQGSSPSTPTVIAMEPQTMIPYVPSSGGGSVMTPVSDAGGGGAVVSPESGEMPGWVIPAAIAGAVLLLSKRR